MESIGRYRIVRELGRGSMGVVYLAEDPAIGRPVAIKTINLDNLSEPGQEQMLRDRLMKEARSAGILSHPGIVTVYDIQQEGHLACIVMEFVEGVTLHERMVRGDLEAVEVLSILEQTAAALDYAHSKGVMHRDIKPANLMFGPTGQVKIADFGVARLNSQKTATSGMMLGTPSYMAPEQISNKPLAGQTDQFSLAVMAFELLTGQKPFDGDSISGLLYNIVFQDPISVRSLNPTLAAAVETVLRKALSKESAGRYPNCAEFVRVLKIACETRKKWKPVSTSRGPKVASPSVLTPPTGSNIPEWSAPEPLPSAVPAAIPAPVAAAAVQPKRETAKVALAFAAGFTVIVGAFFGWQSLRKPAVTEPIEQQISQKPAVTAPPTRSSAPKPKPPAQVPTERSASEPVVKEKVVETLPVEIHSQPPRASITVKEKTCMTPCQLDLPNGEHYVKAELAGYKTIIQMISVPKTLDLAIQMQKPMGTMVVRGPVGATIWIDGKAWKAKAPAIFPLAEGSYSIVLEQADGVKMAEQKVDMTEDKTVTLN